MINTLTIFWHAHTLLFKLIHHYAGKRNCFVWHKFPQWFINVIVGSAFERLLVNSKFTTEQTLAWSPPWSGIIPSQNKQTTENVPKNSNFHQVKNKTPVNAVSTYKIWRDILSINMYNMNEMQLLWKPKWPSALFICSCRRAREREMEHLS